MTRTLSLLLLAAALAACSRTGMGDGVRKDVLARMEATRPTITDCYAKALKMNRKLRGMVVVKFTAVPETGAFEQVEVVRDDVGDEVLTKCVVDAVAAQELAAPQKTTVSITYPIDFAPSN